MANFPPLLLSFDKLQVADVNGKFENDSQRNRSNPYARTNDRKKPGTSGGGVLSDGVDLVKRLINKTLRYPWIPKLYQSYWELVYKIKDASKMTPPDRRRGTADEGLKRAVVETIQVFWNTQNAEKVFVPSYESKFASIPDKGIDPEVAKQLTVGYFNARDRAPFKPLERYDQKKLDEYQKWLSRYETETPEWKSKFEDWVYISRTKEIDRLLRKQRSIKDSEAVKDNFNEANASIIDKFARDAVKSFLSLPGLDQQPLLHLHVSLVLQELDFSDNSRYSPIAREIHTDAESDLMKLGQRYGRPASEQDVTSLVSSFCANLTTSKDGTKEASLDGCGTVYFDGVPVVTPDVMMGLVEAIKERYPPSAYFTEYELISTLGSVFSQATTDVLGEYSEKALGSMGIVSTQSPPLQWSNVNALAFHRSALLDEVKANAIRKPDGTYMPRLRVFSIMVSDPGPDGIGRGHDGKEIEIPDVVDGTGRPMKTTVDVTIFTEWG